jgi:hypothetical protein
MLALVTKGKSITFQWCNSSKIEEMSNNILEKFTINTYINTLWDYFKTKCTDIMEECIPSTTTSTRITQLNI